VVSEAFTRQVPLSTYFDGIRGTLMDVPVFLFDSGVPAGRSSFSAARTRTSQPVP